MPSTQSEPCQLIWRKAQRSMNHGDCLEVAQANGKIFVRDTKNSDGPTLTYPASAWRNFLAEAKRGSIA